MNWRCKIGLHDWEYSEAVGMDKLRAEIFNPGAHIRDNKRPHVYKRLCMCCGKFEDTRTPFEVQCRVDLIKQQQRREFAKRRMEVIKAIQEDIS